MRTRCVDVRIEKHPKLRPMQNSVAMSIQQDAKHSRRHAKCSVDVCVCAVRVAPWRSPQNPTIISPLPYLLRIEVCDEYCPLRFVASLAFAFPAENGVSAKITGVSEFIAIGVAHGAMQPAHKV